RGGDVGSRAVLVARRTTPVLHFRSRRLQVYLGARHRSGDGPSDRLCQADRAFSLESRASAGPDGVTGKHRADRYRQNARVHRRPIDRHPGVAARRPMTLGTISVVIISRNEGARLEATVSNVVRTLPASRRELIVVDDGSTDGSLRRVRKLRDVRVLRSEGIGVANARNFGAS